MKKIFLKIFAFMLLFFGVYNYSFADLTDNSTTTITSKESESISGDAGKKAEKCSGERCITSPDFKINVKDITPGGTFEKGNNLEKKVNNGLLVIIKKLMIPFAIISLLIITIGAGYIILHNGEEEILNKGKKIIKMGIFSIVIALSSYLIIELVKNIIY